MKDGFSKSSKISLAAVWDLVSNIWHEQSEIDFLIKELRIGKQHRLIDVACGNGFHFLELANRGFKIDASDGDKENIFIVNEKVKNIEGDYSASSYYWQTVPRAYSNKYDFVLCLGTAITYFESWEEKALISSEGVVERLSLVLTNLKNLLNTNGKLVLGIADYYDSTSNNLTIEFAPKYVCGNMYSMSWNLFFDWVKHIKYFNCSIKNEMDEKSEINLVSHLFNYADLFELCNSIFDKVEIINKPSNLKDILIVCS